jgi:hypothetical protein
MAHLTPEARANLQRLERMGYRGASRNLAAAGGRLSARPGTITNTSAGRDYTSEVASNEPNRPASVYPSQIEPTKPAPKWAITRGQALGPAHIKKS